MFVRVIALCFLVFFMGSVLTYYKIPPANFFIDAYRAAGALARVIISKNMPYRSDLWADSRNDKKGVTIHQPEKALQGYTLFTSGHKQSAFLVDMQGTVVHEWHLPFRDFWDETAVEQNPVPSILIYMRNARVFPNGDLLAIYAGYGQTPWGYAMVRMDKDSNVIWKYMGRVHHDMDIDEAGNIYTLGHEIVQSLPPDVYSLSEPYIDDYVVVLNPQGEEVKRVSVMQSLYGSKYNKILHETSEIILSKDNGDHLHTNSIDYVTDEIAEQFDFVSEGQVLVSMREFDAIGVIDLEKEEFTWLKLGSWKRQHDPDFLPNGNMLLFDNNGGLELGSSRILEFNPTTSEIVWHYSGDKASPFYSAVRSAQQRLTNGNTLITESSGGRIFEVNRDKEIVWEYNTPHRATDFAGNIRIPVVCSAIRVTPDELDFEFNGGIK